MKEVKIVRKTENSETSFIGSSMNNRHQYLQLCFVESGRLVPDDIYTLKQGDKEVKCSIHRGRVKGAEKFVDSNQPIFLM